MKAVRAVVLPVLLTAAVAVVLGQARAWAATCGAGGTPPAVSTASPAAIGATGATLRGDVNPRGCPTTYQFEFGTATNYGLMTTARAAGTGTGAVAVTSAVTGLAPRTVYHVRLMATSASGTTVGNDVAFTTVANCGAGGPAPTVTTESPELVSDKGATLQGAVDPHGCPTTYHFEFGTSTAYGLLTTTHSAGAGAGGVTVRSAVTGLAAGTVYHYRLVATSGAGTAVGGGATFTTAANCGPGALPPAASSESPTAVSATGARLQGVVNPRGCPTIDRFEFGTTTRYGSLTTPQRLVAGEADVTVKSALSGLTPSTVYHYRLVARNAGGTILGRDISFTTSPPPPSTVTILGTSAPLKRGLVAQIQLQCSGSSQPCVGTLKLFRRHRKIGLQPFTLAANSTGTVSVTLNPRGRRLMRQHRHLRIEVVVRGQSFARSYLKLVRHFRP